MKRSRGCLSTCFAALIFIACLFIIERLILDIFSVIAPILIVGVTLAIISKNRTHIKKPTKPMKQPKRKVNPKQDENVFDLRSIDINEADR